MPKPSDWIYFAEGDLILAKLAIGEELALAGVFYHCQQSAEKALKGYLLFQKQNIRKTHDLVSLLNQCHEFDSEFESIRECANELNPFATVTRYPDDYYILPDASTAKICIEKAERILEFVKSKIHN